MVILLKAGAGYNHCHDLLHAGWSRLQILAWARHLFSTTIQTSPAAHPASYLMDIGCYSGGKETEA